MHVLPLPPSTSGVGCTVVLSAVGKSAFGLVVKRHALRQRPARHVIYLSDKSEDAWVFRANASGDGHDVVPFDKDKLHLVRELKDPRTVLIADSIRPEPVAAFTVMITSPKRDRYKDFYASQPCEKLLFPPFSWAEIRAMRDTCFPACSDSTLEQQYALVGGVPRGTFLLSNEKLDREVNGALTKVDLEAMSREMRNPEIESDTSQSHRLLHMLPLGVAPPVDGARVLPHELRFYSPWRLELASRQIAHRVYACLEADSAHQLHKLLAQPPSAEGLAGFYGGVYEQAALNVLSKGGSFKCLDMQSGKEMPPLQLPRASKTEYFRDARELQALCGADRKQLLVPRSKSFTAIDAVLPGGLMTNVTINVKHDVKLRGRGNRSAEGLLPVAEALGVGSGSGDIKQYWVVPAERYEVLKRAANGAVGGEDSPFALIIPEEQDMRAKTKELEAAAAAAAKKSTGSVDAKAADAALQQYQAAMAPKVAEWEQLKRRVKHYVVCLQFTALP